MGLINNDRIVGIQIAVVGCLRQKNAIGHKFDDAIFAQLFPEPYLVADDLSKRCVEFFRHSIRHGVCRNSTRLCTADQTTHTTTGLQTHFGNLGGFT